MLVPPTAIRITDAFQVGYYTEDAEGYIRAYEEGYATILVKNDLCTFGSFMILAAIDLEMPLIDVDLEYLSEAVSEEWAEHGRLY